MHRSMFAGKQSVVAAAAAAATVLLSSLPAHAAWDVVEKTIPQLESAYATGATTVSEVVGSYLQRINMYDDGPNGVNAVGQINPNVMADAAAVQALINSGATVQQYPLLGVPILIKDSYDVKGMTTTNGVSILNGVGTPGSTNLIAPNDAPNIASLKAAGAIILGKANMSTMAYSFDGIDNAHGVVRNPYNYNRQPGGSSSGSGASAASNFAMLAMGGETGGSIRVPSTYNALVGLKTSAGLISPNGTWPLTPARDVVGPMGKSVTDIAYAMNALVKPNTPDIWSNTPFYPAGTPQPGTIGTGLGEGTDPASPGLTSTTGTRPNDYTQFLSTTSLQGKTLVVPASIIRAGASNTSKAYEGTINPLIYDNFQKQLNVLRARGATIKVMDIPAEVTYFATIGAGTPTTTGFNDKNGNPIPYTIPSNTAANSYTSWAAAYYYQKQIESYNDPTIKNLRDFANALNNGRLVGAGATPLSTLTGAYNNINTLASIWEAGNAKGWGDDNNDGIPDNPEAIKQLAAFTTLRQQFVNEFFDANDIDAIVAPTMGSVAPLVNAALRDPGTVSPDPYGGGSGSLIGRFLGNILGLPALTVPSGFIGDGSISTGIQFEGRLDSEAFLLGLGYDYEQATQYRVAPDLTRYIPEPATLAIVMMGGVMLMRRRKSELN